MNKYSKSKIYKITSLHTESIYIGSTTKSLEKRLNNHISAYIQFLKGSNKYVSSYEVIKYLDVKIELIKNFPCNSRKELLFEESQEIQKNNNCVNIYNPYNDTTKQNKLICSSINLQTPVKQELEQRLTNLQKYNKLEIKIINKSQKRNRLESHIRHLEKILINKEEPILLKSELFRNEEPIILKPSQIWFDEELELFLREP